METRTNNLRARTGSLLCWILLLCAFYHAAALIRYHVWLVQWPYPQEWRESNASAFTQLLIAGKNPYEPALMPSYMNVYGILYHVAVIPFLWLGWPGIVTHRLVAALFLYG